MIFRTHLVFALFLSLVVHNFYPLGWVFFLFVFIGSGFPDIDMPKSKFGKQLGVVSVLVNFFFKHRGYFHSLLLSIGIGSVLIWFWGLNYGLGFFVGFVSHLIMDGLTKQGIEIFYPFKWVKLKGFIKTGGFLETVVFYCILVIDVLILAKLLN